MFSTIPTNSGVASAKPNVRVTGVAMVLLIFKVTQSEIYAAFEIKSFPKVVKDND